MRSWDVKYHSLLKQLEVATTTEERLTLLKEMEKEEKVGYYTFVFIANSVA